jgi:YesN/AraC family two-component response regulator
MNTGVYSKDFEEFLSGVDILYVEDEEQIRELLETRLSRHFGVIHTASNGEVGLYKFDTHRPRIVITDIQMPVMDGLEMLELIREKNPQVKAIITTAHNDIEYIMKSIDIGIDKYIAKPINVENLIGIIKKIAFGFYTENLAKKYQSKSAQEQMSDVMKSVFEQMSNSMPNPMIVYSVGKPIFMNNAFVELFSSQALGQINEAQIGLDELLRIRYTNGGGMSKTTIILPSGRKKIFSVSKTPMSINEQVDATLYMFNDLTMLEYQNAKLQSYADTLYDLLKVKKATPTSIVEAVKAENIKSSEPVIQRKTESLTNLLSGYEMEALKRSHSVKTNAAEYMQEITDDALEELDELSEIETEIGDIIDLFDDDENSGSLSELGRKFVSYSHSIGKLIEFEDLALAVRNFGDFLIISEGDEDIKWTKLLNYARNIKLDLISWRNTIFVNKNAGDIHYLDSSLLSSCIQAQLSSGAQNAAIEDENDLELF